MNLTNFLIEELLSEGLLSLDQLKSINNITYLHNKTKQLMDQNARDQIDTLDNFRKYLITKGSIEIKIGNSTYKLGVNKNEYPFNTLKGSITEKFDEAMILQRLLNELQEIMKSEIPPAILRTIPTSKELFEKLNVNSNYPTVAKYFNPM